MKTRLFFLFVILSVSWNAQAQEREFSPAEKMIRYDSLVAQGERYVSDFNFEQAKIKFNEAASLRPASEVKYRLKYSNEMLALISYKRSTIEEGDKLFTEGKLLEAKEKYETAINMQFGQPANYQPDQYALMKVSEIKKQLIPDQEKQLKIDNLIKEGNTLFSERKFAEARTKFEQVLIYQVGNEYAQSKLAEIITLLKDKK